MISLRDEDGTQSQERVEPQVDIGREPLGEPVVGKEKKRMEKRSSERAWMNVLMLFP